MASILDWIKEHRIASIVILVILAIVISGIWWVSPAYFGLSHTNLQNCGSVSRTPGPQLQTEGNSSPEQIVQCFMQAHQQCRTASIAYTTFEIDAGFTETFYTANALGQCALSEQTTNHVIPLGNKTSDATCSSMRQEADGLHFNCGSAGELVFPVR